MQYLVSYAAVFSGVTQRSPEVLRDATKNGCVGDYAILTKIQLSNPHFKVNFVL